MIGGLSDDHLAGGWWDEFRHRRRDGCRSRGPKGVVQAALRAGGGTGSPGRPGRVGAAGRGCGPRAIGARGTGRLRQLNEADLFADSRSVAEGNGGDGRWQSWGGRFGFNGGDVHGGKFGFSRRQLGRYRFLRAYRGRFRPRSASVTG